MRYSESGLSPELLAEAMSAFGGKSEHRADSSASPLMTLFRYSATAVERVPSMACCSHRVARRINPNSSNQRQFILFRQISVRKRDGQRR
jgi:hypothetical protein